MKKDSKKVNKNIDGSDLEFYNEDTRDEFEIDSEESFGEQAEDTIKSLKKKLSESEREKIENLTGWQRSKADYINLKKRSVEGWERNERLATERVVMSFLPVLDSFEVSMRGEVWEKADEKWKSGVLSIYRQFISSLQENNVEQVGEVGELFDPRIHTSVSVRSTENQEEDNVIAEVVQKGYQFVGGEIIRSPKVIIFEKTS